MPLSAFEAEPDPLGRPQRQRINKTGASNPGATSDSEPTQLRADQHDGSRLTVGQSWASLCSQHRWETRSTARRIRAARAPLCLCLGLFQAGSQSRPHLPGPWRLCNTMRHSTMRDRGCGLITLAAQVVRLFRQPANQGSRWGSARPRVLFDKVVRVLAAGRWVLLSVGVPGPSMGIKWRLGPGKKRGAADGAPRGHATPSVPPERVG